MTLPATADEWLSAVHKEFARESDRAACIVAAAMLDEALKALIARRLLPPPKKRESIVEGFNAPLGSLSARIDAAFQLGLISHFLARDLHLIRQIRNEFAHFPLERTFDTPSVRDRVRVLEAASDYNNRNPELRKSIGPPGVRWDFLGIAAWILYSLHRDIETTESIGEHGPEFGYLDWDQLRKELRDLLPQPEAT